MNPLPLLLLALAPPDFETEVLPVLTRAGCNSGACHGAAAGRGGFRLSLWGSDPAGDHDALVRESEGRRVDLARPARSLLLLKPTGELRHGGGRKLDPDGAGARRLLRWIEGGAPRAAARRLTRFTVTPAEAILERTGQPLQLRAHAEFSNGTREEVTAWTVFTSQDSGAVDLDSSGKLIVRRPGQHLVLARFLDRVVPVRVTVPLSGKPLDLGRLERHNWIDDEILATLSALRLAPAPLCDDSTFLRRVSLDLTGTLPTPARVEAFLRDARPERRERLVEELLAAVDFVDVWALKWATRLRIQSRSLGQEGTQRYHAWIREQVKRNTPLDRMATELLTALGDSRRSGPANFSRVSADAREQAELVGRVFLGARLQCANCHDHPLDRWKQDDYHGLAAVFARLERGPIVRLVSHGEVIHPRHGEPARPRLPGDRFLDAAQDNRERLANWIVSKDNPLFARSAVNWVWKELMGRGLVDPVDDLRQSNPATHPVLLDRLARDLVRHDFDIRRTIRLIVSSATYQRGRRMTGQPADDRFHSHSLVRPLPAEVLADAIVAVTDVPDRHGTFPEGTRAIALPDSLIPSPALEVLGRCSRQASCEEAADRGGLARTLHLINGPLLNEKIASPRGRLRTLLAAGREPGQIIEELYLRALGRSLSAKEAVYWKKALSEANSRQERERLLEDFLWAILTSKEFTHNH